MQRLTFNIQMKLLLRRQMKRKTEEVATEDSKQEKEPEEAETKE